MKSLIKHVDNILRVKEYYIVNKALERIFFLSDDSNERAFLKKFSEFIIDQVDLKYNYEEIDIAAKGLKIQLAYDLICAADKYTDSSIPAPEFIVNFLKNRYNENYGGIFTPNKLDEMSDYIKEHIKKDQPSLHNNFVRHDTDNLDHLFMNHPWELEDLMELSLEKRMSRFTIKQDLDIEPFSTEYDDNKVGSSIYDLEKDFEKFFREHPLLVKIEELEAKKNDFNDQELYNYVTVYKYNGEYSSYKVPVEPEEERNKEQDPLDTF